MGLVASFLSQLFPPKPSFTTADIPDLTGTVCIVTGGYSGIGKDTVMALLEHNAKVYIAGRNPVLASQAIDELREETGREALFLRIDLADLKSVKAGVENFLRMEKELHVLYNNAGVALPPIDQLTADGYDLQFGTNVLGHFYLTRLLLPILLETARSSPIARGKTRVVTTSSITHHFATLDYCTFRDGPQRRATSLETLYAQSKFGNVVFAMELAGRYGDMGIVSTVLNPGNLKTRLLRHCGPLYTFFISMALHDSAFGALTQLWAGTSKEGANFNGKYLIPWARFGQPRTEAQDPEVGKELWRWLEEQVEGL